MRSTHIALFGVALLNPVNAHYKDHTGRLILDNKWTDTWEYVRQISPAPNMTPDLAPLAPNIEPKSNDIRCGRNATIAWNKPKTAKVQAGSTIGFGVSGSVSIVDGAPRLYHPGFMSAFLSKSPLDDLNAYSGDGDWFKIMSVTGRTKQSLNFDDGPYKQYYDPYKAIWGSYLVDSWNFTIPATTPPGKYLLRFEHIFPNPEDSQYYPNCAHVEIVNDNTAVGNPSPLVKIPGVYIRGQKDVYFDKYDPKFNISTFVAPAPVVWSG